MNSRCVYFISTCNSFHDTLHSFHDTWRCTDRWMLTFQKTMVWKSDGGQNSMEACDESSSSEVYRNPSQVQQAESKEIHLPKGSLFLHSGLPLRSHLLLQRGVPSRSPAAKKLQLYEVEIRRGVVGKDRKHEDFCRGTNSVQGEVTDG